MFLKFSRGFQFVVKIVNHSLHEVAGRILPGKDTLRSMMALC